jgi:hypothetical protein
MEEGLRRAVSFVEQGGAPRTLDVESRSVEWVLATEAPVDVYDFSRGIIPEVLPIGGLTGVPSKLICLDSHDRFSTKNIVGSVRDLRIERDRLVGRVYFSKVQEGEDCWTKVQEGTLDSGSIGYRIDEVLYLDEGESQQVHGQTYTGPMRIGKRWSVREFSVCAIGADPQSKARSASPLAREKESPMEPELQQPQAQTPPKTPEPPPAAADESKASLAKERERVAQIYQIASRYQMQELAERAVFEGTSVEGFKAAVLDHMTEQAPKVSARIEAGRTDGEKLTAAIQDSILYRGGVTQTAGAAEGTDVRGWSLMRIAEESGRRAGIRLGSNVYENLGRLMTTSDLPGLLTDTAKRSLGLGFEESQETWEEVFSTGEVSDFKIQAQVRLSEMDDLELVPEGGEYKYGTRVEAFEKFQISKWGKIFSLSKEAVINDDLGALTDIPYEHGRSASRKIGDLAWEAFSRNEIMGDGKPLFDPEHGNLVAEQGLNVDILGKAVLAMRSQKDMRGLKRLGIRPQYFIAPTAMETSSEQFFRSNFEGTGDRPNIVNPFAGTYLTRIYEPRLDDADTANTWYLAGDKNRTVRVYFLRGNRAPRLETREGWAIDGMEWKVSLECAAKAQDWKSLVKVSKKGR